jgi:hypothetical protein
MTTYDLSSLTTPIARRLRAGIAAIHRSARQILEALKVARARADRQEVQAESLRRNEEQRRLWLR